MASASLHDQHESGIVEPVTFGGGAAQLLVSAGVPLTRRGDAAGVQDLSQLFTGESQTTLTGRQRDIHDLGDFRQAHSAVVVQSEGLPLLFRDQLESLFDQFGDLALVSLILGRNHFTRDPVQDIVLLIARAFHCPHEGVIGLPPNVIDQQIASDTKEPAAKPAHGEIIPRLLVELDQRVLSQVLGQLNIAGISQEESDQWRLILINEFIEGGIIPLLKSDHQLVIIGHRTYREWLEPAAHNIFHGDTK